VLLPGRSCCFFFSGADRPPPLGFPCTPQLHYLLEDAIFPTSSTCSLILRLPTRHQNYDDFRDAMIRALKENDGFGAGP